jgi:polyisoprenoid-binding protein YceI
MNKQIFLTMAALFMLMVSVTLSAQQSIKVDLSESKINWSGKSPTGEHKGFVKLSNGELNVDKGEIKGGSFSLDMTSITNTDITDEESNKKLVTHLKSNDFFDVQKFPTAKFVITKVTKQNNSSTGESKATHRVEGDLTIKGVTKRIGFDASINLLNGKFAASTPPFTINRTEWGVNYQSKSVIEGLKDQFIYDDITISIELVSN